MINSAVNPGRIRKIPWELTRAVLETDYSHFLPPQQVSTRPKASYPKGILAEEQYRPKTYIPIQHQDIPDPDYVPTSTDPYHHIQHWVKLGFTASEISTIVGVPAGDILRAIEGKDIGSNSSRTIVRKSGNFRSHLL